MSNVKKLMMTAAGGEALNVEDVFSTYLYTGDSTSPRTITNGIDLSGEGGLVWFKSRTTTTFHGLFDTERGATKRLRSDSTNAEDTLASDLTAFNSDGFTLGNGGTTNTSPREYASWTFRKAPKFFDVVTYTGDGTDARTVSHNLGVVPGMMIVKRTDTTGNWCVYHRSLNVNGDNAPETDYMYLNSTQAASDTDQLWDDTAPTATEFTLHGNAQVNASGGTYVAYLFAHNDGDGGFGSTGDQDIIKCGDVIGSGTTSFTSVDLGFEPQWIMIKRYDSTGGGTGQEWTIIDNMRFMGEPDGSPGTSDAPKRLYANSSAAEADYDLKLFPTATGFEFSSVSGYDYIYIAIRRGPMAVPESATDVFGMDTYGGTLPNPPAFDLGAPVDFGMWKQLASTSSWITSSRLQQGKVFYTDSDSAEANDTSAYFDFQEGWYDASGTSTSVQSWMWRRAPNFFDVVAYEGTGSNQTIDHNLGIAPEMMWVKARSRTGQWIYYHSAVGNTGAMWINDIGDGVITDSTYWNNTSPSSTNFSLGNNYRVNQSSQSYIAYLFASVDGVSKVGSYTGDGTNGRTIDCGFSSGARFVLIKDTAANTPFQVYDSERGIVSGNDPLLQLNSTAAEVTSFDFLDPDSSGFQINSTINYVNQSGRTYTFYAIA